MIKKLDAFLFGNVPFICKSKYSLEESVVRLRQATRRSVFESLFQQNAVGKVTESKVRLQRVIPMFGNSFKPIFLGKFHTKNGQVFLEGKFTTFMFSKIFMIFWFGFAAFWTLIAFFIAVAAIATNFQRFGIELIHMLFPIVGLAFFAIGFLFIKGCWRLSSKDMDYLKTVISKAIAENS